MSLQSFSIFFLFSCVYLAFAYCRGKGFWFAELILDYSLGFCLYILCGLNMPEVRGPDNKGTTLWSICIGIVIVVGLLIRLHLTGKRENE